MATVAVLTVTSPVHDVAYCPEAGGHPGQRTAQGSHSLKRKPSKATTELPRRKSARTENWKWLNREINYDEQALLHGIYWHWRGQIWEQVTSRIKEEYITGTHLWDQYLQMFYGRSTNWVETLQPPDGSEPLLSLLLLTQAEFMDIERELSPAHCDPITRKWFGTTEKQYWLTYETVEQMRNPPSFAVLQQADAYSESMLRWTGKVDLEAKKTFTIDDAKEVCGNLRHWRDTNDFTRKQLRDRALEILEIFRKTVAPQKSIYCYDRWLAL